MAEEDIGSTGITVGADVSGFLEAMDAITSGAQTSFSAVGRSAEQMQAEVVPALDAAGGQFNLFAEQIVAAGTAIGGQLPLWTSQLPAGFTETAAAAAQAEAAIQKLPPPFTEAQQTMMALQAASKEASLGLSDLTQSLVAFSGIQLGLSGLKTLATEALEAYGNFQKAEASLTALTGSAEKADTAIQGLRGLADQDALSFPTLVTAYQRMTALGFATEQIPAALHAAADAAAALGTNISTVTGSIDRLSLSGNAGARQLTALGLSTKDLAAVMGVATDQVKKAFAALDQEARVDVLVQALQKFQGSAEAVANTLPGQFQRMHNAVEQSLEGVGQALAPAAIALASFVTGAVLPSINTAVTTFNNYQTALIGAAKVTADFVVTGTQLEAAMLGIKSPTKETGELVKQVAQESFTDSLIPGLRLATESLGLFSRALNDVKPAAANAKDIIDQFQKTLSNLSHTITTTGNEFRAAFADSLAAAGLGKLTDAEQKAIDTSGKLQQSVEDAGRALDSISRSFQNGTAMANGHFATLQDLNSATNIYNSALKALQGTQKDDKNSVEALTKSMADAAEKADSWHQIYTTLLQKQQDGINVTALLAEAYNKWTSAAKSAGQAVADVAGIVAQLQGKTQDTINTVTNYVAVWKSLNDQNPTSIQGQLALADSLSKAQAAAQALGLAVTMIGNTPFFQVKDPAGPAAASLQALADQLNSASGASNAVVINVNGKLVPSLKSVAEMGSSAADGISKFVTTATGAVVKVTNFSEATQDFSRQLTGTATAVSNATSALAGNSQALQDQNTKLTQASQAASTHARTMGDVSTALQACSVNLQNFKDEEDDEESAADSLNTKLETTATDLSDVAAAAAKAASAMKDLDDNFDSAGVSGISGMKTNALDYFQALAAIHSVAIPGGATLADLDAAARAAGLVGSGGTYQTKDQYNAQVTANTSTAEFNNKFGGGMGHNEVVVGQDGIAYVKFIKDASAAISANTATVTANTAATEAAADAAKIAKANTDAASKAMADYTAAQVAGVPSIYNWGTAVALAAQSSMDVAKAQVTSADAITTAAGFIQATAISTAAVAAGALRGIEEADAAPAGNPLLGLPGNPWGTLQLPSGGQSPPGSTSTGGSAGMLQVLVTGNTIMGDQGVNSLATMVQGSTLALLRQAGLKL